MQTQSLVIIDIKKIASAYNAYANLLLAQVNGHVIKMSVMTEPYFWHLHPDSDESFLVIEGSLFVDLEDKTIELLPNQLFTIPKNVKHRTRPCSKHSVNLTFEKQNITTINIENE